MLYADLPLVRTRQILGDGLVLLVAWFSARTALRLREAILELQTVGAQLQSSGRSVTGGADRAGEALRQLPAVGEQVAGPFGRIGEAGDGLTDAGSRVSEAVATTAFVLPLLLVGLVLGYLLFRYLPARVRWIREATEVQRLLTEPDAAQLLGIRAVSRRPLRVLRTQVPDPARALRDARWGDLAAVELAALGLAQERLDRVAGADDPAPPRRR